MSPTSVLITGANRGIGLEFVKQFLQLSKPPANIFATCRKPKEAKELQKLAKDNSSLHILELDVKDHSKYSSVVKEVESIVSEHGLNVLINNAGIIVRDKLENITADQMREVLEVNTIAPLMLTKAFLPLLKQAATKAPEAKLSWSKAAVFSITSKMGSIDDNTSGSYYAYRTSKAALNMVTKSLSVDLLPNGILAVTLHPGWVQTEMGGPSALISTVTSVEGMMNVMAKIRKEDSGFMFEYSGPKIAW